MLDYLIIFVKILVIITGVFFAYLAAFTYETEDNVVHDKFAEWWIKLDDFSFNYSTLIKKFIEQVALLCQAWLNDFFGKSIFSKQAISVSMCFTLGSYLLFGGIFAYITGMYLELDYERFIKCLKGGLFLIGFGYMFFSLSLNPKRGYAPPIKTMYLIILFLILVILRLKYFHTYNIEQWSGRSRLESLSLYYALTNGLVISILIDLFSVFFFRLMLNLKTKFNSPLIFLFILSITTSVIFIIAGVIPFHIFTNWIKNISIEPSITESYLFYVSTFVLFSNLLSYILMTIFFGTSAILIIIKFCLPVISRLVYAADRYNLIGKKKTLWSISVLFFTAPTYHGLISFFKTFLVDLF